MRRTISSGIITEWTDNPRKRNPVPSNLPFYPGHEWRPRPALTKTRSRLGETLSL